jgi:hypothetical protein
MSQLKRTTSSTTVEDEENGVETLRSARAKRMSRGISKSTVAPVSSSLPPMTDSILTIFLQTSDFVLRTLAHGQLISVFERNGLVLLSETVALGDVSGDCKGLRTCDHDRLRRYIEECAIVDAENGELGCKFTYHSEALLGGEHAGWYPEAK